MKTELRLKTEDHPEANGRKAVKGDKAYEMRFPLEDGRELVLEYGELCYQVITTMLIDMMANTPNYNDGTTNIPKE